jgi:hypothetical protein
VIQRRNLLLGLAGLGVVGAALRWSGASLAPQDAVKTIIYKRLDYLSLDAAGVSQFAADYVSAMNISAAKLRLIGALAPIYRRLSSEPGHLLYHATRYGEERVVTRYLLSSDFFASGADETRTVQYLGFYDPLRACGNPFRRPVLVPPAIANST